MTRTAFWSGLAFLILTPATWAQNLDWWNNPRAEAEILALEVSGELRPPAPLADQIEADLATIRSAFPEFDDIRVLPDWMPGELLTALTPSAYADFKNGTFTGFDSLFAALGTPQINAHDFGEWLHLQFGQVYHGARLAELFEPVDGVRYAEPNGLIGDGNDIVARLDRTYTLSRGFGDCPAGCIYHESWDFAVTDDGAILLPEPGSAGDFNNDGLVDAADYVTWRSGLGSLYNEADYTGWKSSYGDVPSGAAALAATVPEPTSGILLLPGLTLNCMRRRNEFSA